MDLYIFLLKMLLLMSMFLAPLKAIGRGFPNLYMLLAVALPIFVVLILIVCLIRKRVMISHIWQIIIFFVAMFLWIGIGKYNGFSVVSEAGTLILMILSLISITISYNERLISVDYIKKIAYLLMYCWSGIYALIALGIIFNVIPNTILMQLITIWLEANPNTTMDSGFLGLIPRMGAGENILPLIIYAFYLIDKKAGSSIVWVIMFLYVIIDYGRIDMLFFAFLTMIFFYYKYIEHNISIKAMLKICISLFLIVIFICMFFSVNNIDIGEFVTGWTERYGRESTERYIQLKYLIEYMNENLWIGQGLGAYIPEYIRSDILWVYEMQFHAFLMQMGIIGFIAIIVNYIILYLRVVFENINKRYIFITLSCLTYWLVESGLQGGVFYGVGRMIFIVIYFFSRQENNSDLKNTL